jgi:hypothetical protein
MPQCVPPLSTTIKKINLENKFSSTTVNNLPNLNKNNHLIKVLFKINNTS